MSMVVLCVLAGLPIATAVCGSVCGSSETATVPSTGGGIVKSVAQHHHGPAHANPEMRSEDRLRMASTTAHECGATDNVLLRSETARTAGRGDVHVTVLVQSPARTSSAPQAPAFPPGWLGDDASRPGRSSARTPLVLRV